MLDRAVELASETGDIPTALEAITELENEFEQIDFWEKAAKSFEIARRSNGSMITTTSMTVFRCSAIGSSRKDNTKSERRFLIPLSGLTRFKSLSWR